MRSLTASIAATGRAGRSRASSSVVSAAARRSSPDRACAPIAAWRRGSRRLYATQADAAAPAASRVPARAAAMLKCVCFTSRAPSMFRRSHTPRPGRPRALGRHRRRERSGRKTHIELIASENYASPAVHGGAGLAAHQQVRRGLSGQALLRRLRVRRHRRAARDRPREEAVRRRRRQRPAAFGRAGQPGGVLRGAEARRHDPRHVAAARRPPDARLAGEHVSGKWFNVVAYGLDPRDRAHRLRRGRAARARAQAEADHRRRVGLFARHRLEALSRDRRRRRRAADGRHGALRRPGRRRPLSRRRSASPISSPAPRTRRCAARAAASSS